MLISEAWSSFDLDKRLEGYSPHTLKGYKLQAKLLTDFFGDVDITAVTYEDLKRYLIFHAERLKPASLAHRIKFIRSLFRWAVDNGHVPLNPSIKLKEPKQGTRIPKAMTEEDVELLRESCTSPLEHALVEFIYTTGCRLGEVGSLNRADINWGNRSVIVWGKGDKEWEVYFNIKCEIWLKWYLKSREDDEPALFATEREFQIVGQGRGPRRMSTDQIRYILKRVADRGGVEVNVYPHKLRHSFATHLLNNGAPLEAIQSFLGHAKIETTKIYADLSGERRRELYKKYFK